MSCKPSPRVKFNHALLLGMVLLGLMPTAQTQTEHTIPNDETLRFTVTNTCTPRSPPTCVTQIKAIGKFSKDSPEELQQTIKRLPPDNHPIAIHFSSLGGNLIAGLQVGQLLREHEFISQTGFDESVCYSACTYAFMGGSIRQLGPKARFGLHQFYSPTNNLNASKTQSVTALVSNYLDVMGIDRQVLKIALGTQPNRIVILPIEQAKQLRIDNSANPYAAWKLEATPQGLLSLITTERQPGRPWLVTALLSHAEGQPRLLIQLKKLKPDPQVGWLEGLSARYTVRVGTQLYELKPLRTWHTTQATISQAWFNVPKTLIDEWNKPSNSGWEFVIEGAEEQLQDNQLKARTRFGLMNFSANWQAVNRSRQ